MLCKSKRKTDVNTSETKNVVPAYKYSNRGKGNLHEAIILGGQPCFLVWYQNAGYNIKAAIEESSRIIRPPNPEEYPYTPYDFADESELRYYFRRANMIKSRGDLYFTAK